MAESNQCPQCGCEIPPDSPAGVCPDCLLTRGLGGFASDPGHPAAAAPSPAPITPSSSGSGFVPPGVDALAPLFPGLEILEPLGHGGMGAVYKARQTKLDRLVALKIIRPETADDPTFAERFMREARTLARLNHPSIVAVHDFGEVPMSDEASAGSTPAALYYFVMEFVDGLNLRQLIEAQELPTDQAMSIIPQVCEALQFAHDEGIVHRDIKPENILIDRRGRVKIADFGLAKLAEKSDNDLTLTATHQVMGTPRYMAPEQMTGSHAVDHRADIYSLGVVFYELLTGELPLGQFDPPSRKAGLDTRLDDVVLRALAREPERRFQQASELKSHVEYLGLGPDATQFVDAPVSAASGRPAVSAIMEREAVAAWRWVAGTPNNKRQRKRPEPPALLMFVLAVAGCLSILAPWARVELPKRPSQSADRSSAGTSVISSGGLSYGYWQDTESASDSGFSYSITTFTPTAYGSHSVSGVLASVLFAFMAVLIMATPSTGRSSVLWALIMTLLAGAALIATLAFQHEARSEFVSNMSTFVGPDWIEQGYRFADIDNSMQFLPGFYAALGLSVALLVLSATGVRHAIAYREPAAPKPEPTGTPVARLRFSVPASTDVASHVAPHFESHGYRLKRQQAGEWVLQRGNRYAGLFATDIRSFETTLTVRASVGPSGETLVTCLWEMHTSGGIVTKRDIRRLEDEGHELETLLVPERAQVRQEHVAVNESGLFDRVADGIRTIRDAAVKPAVAVDSQQVDSSSLIEVDIDPETREQMLQLRLKSPAHALKIAAIFPAIFWIMFGGFWIVDGYGPFFTGQYALPMSAVVELISFGLAYLGVTIVCWAMAHGAGHMQRRSSYPWAMAAAVIAVVPWHLTWVVTFPVGLWSLIVLGRRDVRESFLQRALELQRESPKETLSGHRAIDEVRTEIDGPAVGLIAAGLLMAVGHIIALLAFDLNGMPEPPYLLLGVLTGCFMVVGGARMRALKSPGIGMAGAIAALCPVSPMWPITIPIGIIVIRRLNKPHVRNAFAEHMREERERGPDAENRATAWGFGWWLATIFVFVLFPIAVAAMWGASREDYIPRQSPPSKPAPQELLHEGGQHSDVPEASH